jgi:hypothetical protein
MVPRGHEGAGATPVFGNHYSHSYEADVVKPLMRFFCFLHSFRWFFAISMNLATIIPLRFTEAFRRANLFVLLFFWRATFFWDVSRPKREGAGTSGII